ncbi:MAG: hypothetical protein B5M52_02165 [Helicobacteraceae bacterium 4484_230]|nr:MAG: hypothetical protein B5M52_02165 [Helicobacteraceae bacterium 4484_230]
MDSSLIYPASLALIALLSFVLYQNNNIKLMLIMLGIGVYIIYSHETGHTMTEFKKSMVESLDKSASEYQKDLSSDVNNPNKAAEHIK